MKASQERDWPICHDFYDLGSSDHVSWTQTPYSDIAYLKTLKFEIPDLINGTGHHRGTLLNTIPFKPKTSASHWKIRHLICEKTRFEQPCPKISSLSFDLL